MATKSKKNIQETIIAVRSAMGVAVPKNGYNSFHKYKFAKASDVIAHCREACDDNNLVIVPMGVCDVSFHKGDCVVSGNVSYKLIAEDSSELLVTVLASGEDKGDKHAYKLMTGALKYLLMQVFLLETDDDPEATEGDTPTAKAKPDVKLRTKVDTSVHAGAGGNTTAKKAMPKKLEAAALERITEEGEVYYNKLKAHYALTENQGKAFMERLAYTKGMDKLT